MDNGRRTTFAIGVFLLAAAFLLLTRCGTGTGGGTVGAVQNKQGPAESRPITSTPVAPNRGSGADDRGAAAGGSPTSRSSVPATTADPAPSVVATETGPARLTIDGKDVLPLSRAGFGRDGDLSRLSGGRAVARRVRVLGVDADEGFWIGIGSHDAVWVQLAGPPPESPYTVLPGDSVSFTGRLVPNGRGFADRVGVDASEGAGILTRQRQHIQVDKRQISLFHQP